MKNGKPLGVYKAQPAADGDGVKLLRVFGGRGVERFDPFLMLDEFGSEEAADYIGGFPPHPHRGFETVTYMLQGKMEHRDHMDNVGLLNDGDVQWMTAGSGIIHSEMPKQTEGKMRGFQFWLNLPSDLKMQEPKYLDIPGETLKKYQVPSGKVIAIAGSGAVDDMPIDGLMSIERTEPRLWDIHLTSDEALRIVFPLLLNVMIYVYDGSVEIVGESGSDRVSAQHLAHLGELDKCAFKRVAGNEPARMMLFAGLPLKEPIVQYGPFVMNTQEQINQALTDYRNGVLVG